MKQMYMKRRINQQVHKKKAQKRKKKKRRKQKEKKIYEWIAFSTKWNPFWNATRVDT